MYLVSSCGAKYDSQLPFTLSYSCIHVTVYFFILLAVTHIPNFHVFLVLCISKHRLGNNNTSPYKRVERSETNAIQGYMIRYSHEKSICDLIVWWARLMAIYVPKWLFFADVS